MNVSPSTNLLPLRRLWAAHRNGAVASDSVHSALREAIVSGALSPGTRLGEQAVSSVLELSRTPIREAFLRLESERLVSRAARRGLVVAEVTPDEILEVYAVREVINGFAARLASANASPSDVDRLRRLAEAVHQAYEGGDLARMAERNLVFHEALCGAGRNELVLRFLRQIHDMLRRFPGTTFSVPGRAFQALAEHDELLDAIANHDADRAEAVARMHMANAMRARVWMLDGTQERPAPRNMASPVPRAPRAVADSGGARQSKQGPARNGRVR
jgi:DNA-binding GntR family transcriptional regulator